MAKGQLNIYTCPSGHELITIDRDEGTTPFMTPCVHCGEPAQSSFYRVPPDLTPTHEWYKAKIKRGMSPATKDHIKRGGLILRPIEKQPDYIEGPAADQWMVERIMNHLLGALEDFVNAEADHAVDFLDVFMAVHNVHVVTVLDIEKRSEDDTRIWRETALGTFERAMKEKEPFKRGE